MADWVGACQPPPSGLAEALTKMRCTAIISSLPEKRGVVTILDDASVQHLHAKRRGPGRGLTEVPEWTSNFGVEH